MKATVKMQLQDLQGALEFVRRDLSSGELDMALPDTLAAIALLGVILKSVEITDELH